MSWKDGKRAQALTKTQDYYTPHEIQEAWLHTFTGQYADILIYSLFLETNKPSVKLDAIDPNAAVFREGKRDLIDQILRQANAQLTKERENGR